MYDENYILHSLYQHIPNVLANIVESYIGSIFIDGKCYTDEEFIENKRMRLNAVHIHFKKTYTIDTEQFFAYSKYLTRITGETIILKGYVDNCFCGCVSLIEIPNIESSQATSMSHMFSGAVSFNKHLDHWNTENVKDMRYMFFHCFVFNGRLFTNTSNVNNMSFMFYGSRNFNQSLDKWDTSNVTSMNYMFYGCASFRQTLDWDVDEIDVRNMLYKSYGLIKNKS